MEEKFNYAIKWLEANTAENRCSQYSLLHGEYHPGHTIITNNGTLKVIDWESVDIGDPAFDVGYAYNMINLMYCPRTSKSERSPADEFISEYAKNYRESFNRRIEFYRLVGILSIAIDVSSWLSNPLTAYKRFGRKALARFSLSSHRFSCCSRKMVELRFPCELPAVFSRFYQNTLKYFLTGFILYFKIAITSW